MLMWLFIFIGSFIAFAAGLIYISNRISELPVFEKLSQKKKVRKAISFALILAAAFLCYLGMGAINTVVSFIHVMCIWILMDLIFFFIKKKWKKTLQKGLMVALPIAVSVGYLTMGWYMAHHVVATHYQIKNNKNAGKLRLVQITDAHIGATYDGAGFAKEMQKVQAEHPDVVVVTGDFIDYDSKKEEMEASCEALGKLKTTYGVYFVFGNHDKNYSGNEETIYPNVLYEALRKNGIHILEDETVLLNDNFYLIGRKDRSEEYYGNTREEMQSLVAELDRDKYSIVLDHQPNDYKNQIESKVDMVLSGHTHGGQFIPIRYMGQWTGLNDKTYGLSKIENTNFIVSSAISDWAIKFKTGCRAEYVVIDIEP